VQTARSRAPALLGGVLVVLGALALWWFARPAPFLWPTIPSPNAYLDLLDLSRELSTMNPAPPIGAPSSTNAPPEPPPAEFLVRVHNAIQREGAAPTGDMLNRLPAHLNDLALLKHLSHALVAEADSQLRLGQTNQTASVGLDLVRLGAMAGRYGVLIDRLVGLAIERQGIDILQRCEPGMSPDTIRFVVIALERMDPELSDSAATLRLEQAYFDRQASFMVRFLFRVQEALGRSLLRAARNQFQSRMQSAILQRRALTLRLTARRDQFERQRQPATANDLAPD